MGFDYRKQDLDGLYLDGHVLAVGDVLNFRPTTKAVYEPDQGGYATDFRRTKQHGTPNSPEIVGGLVIAAKQEFNRVANELAWEKHP